MKQVRDTSITAYLEIKRNGLLSETRQLIYEYVYSKGPKTAREVLRDLNLETNLSGRFTEMREMGVFKEVGKRKCTVTGRMVIEWDVTQYLPEPLEKAKPSNDKVKDKIIKILDDYVHIRVAERITDQILSIEPSDTAEGISFKEWEFGFNQSEEAKQISYQEKKQKYDEYILSLTSTSQPKQEEIPSMCPFEIEEGRTFATVCKHCGREKHEHYDYQPQKADSNGAEEWLKKNEPFPGCANFTFYEVIVLLERFNQFANSDKEEKERGITIVTQPAEEWLKKISPHENIGVRNELIKSGLYKVVVNMMDQFKST